MSKAPKDTPPKAVAEAAIEPDEVTTVTEEELEALGVTLPSSDYIADLSIEGLGDELKRMQKDGILPDQIPRWYSRFLCALAERPIVSRAVFRCGLRSRKTVYRHREKWAGFSELWDWALEVGLDSLESSAWDRARLDNSMVMFLLNYHKDRRNRSGVGTGGGVAGPTTGDIRFTLVIDEEADEDKKVLP